ncbi:DUF3710 domain-containing protein [Streptomyces cylindrosporus]|uniref:DUF3710 domain-containing protein n=1 Tax=Streptomyces cylindrosporus TaxID=2927583 RepID=A0ABS9Y4M9_9ACTN|nr:DUF3710 domain-containing protein [Streptomyces cylindrosporus]MCI3272182.1 DUF3710 domain-containing protein [Streptomyces cylindrosporus]
MNDIQARTRAILDQYERDGALSAQSVDLAMFGVWDQVTPGALILGAAALIDTEDPTLAQEADRTGGEVLAAFMRGGLEGLALTDQGAEFGWDDVVALVQAYLRRSGTPPDALDRLLTEAESLWTEIVQSGEVTRPRVRNGEFGPWDATEDPLPPGTERIDYGVLKVPQLVGAEMRPLREGGRQVGVIVGFAGHDLWLQVFRAPQGPVWDDVRPRLEGAVLARGGTVTADQSTLGAELRARIPVTHDDGHQELLPTRFLGCDGPGWLLRGLFRGPDALAEVVDPRAHHLFTQTVVALPPAAQDDGEEGTAVEVTVAEVTVAEG